MSEIDTLAQDFVSEYLERSPEYLDVVEFVEENIEDEDAITDELLAEVFKKVNGNLDTIAQRWDDQ